MGLRHRRAWGSELEQEVTPCRRRLGWRPGAPLAARRSRHEEVCVVQLRRCAQGGRSLSWRRMF